MEDNKKLKEQLIKLKRSLEEYLDYLNMDEVETKDDKKEGKKKDKEEEDG